MNEEMGQWESECKRCGNKIGYSDRSYKVDLEKGFTRPLYCDDCQKKETKARIESGIAYLPMKTTPDVEITGFGKLNHFGEEHTLSFKKSEFNEDEFGLTPKKIKELADWFKNPKHRVAVVCGPTGSGKSTALPAWLVNPPKELGIPQDYFTREGQIIHTQPRINATEGQVNFVAEKLMGVDVGAGFDVGIINSKNKNSDRRNLWVSVTDGTFINLIIKGKLGNFGYIIIDEAHERSLNIDQILRLLKERLSLYPKIKIIIASATINAKAFREFFGTEITKIIEFEGKERKDKEGKLISYQKFYQDSESALPYEDFSKLGDIIVNAALKKTLSLVEEIVAGKKKKGDILVFLQGMKPINNAVERARDDISHSDNLANIVEVYPLYRDLSTDEKDKINTHKLEDGKIWIIFSTNIAEASVTISSLGYEIETGVENQSVFDSKTNTTQISLNLISKANARQRWGRTGRNRNGEVYCLYTEDQFNNLFLEYPVADIKRSSLEDTLLVMKLAGIPNPSEGWLEDPDIKEIERSNTTLVDSGIITKDGILSKRGLLLSGFPYPAKLVDALFMADSLGIIIEIASVLSVVRNGGNKKILDWNYSWDAYTKKDAFEKQKALMSGCYDDIEFVLKIIKLWTELSWLEPSFLENKNSKEKDLIRHDWAKRNFIKIDVMEKIIQEREELFNHFFEDTKYENIRQIDFSLLSKIRLLLLNLFPEIKIRDLQIPYEYDPSIKPEEESYINCNCLIQESSMKKIDDWMNPLKLKINSEKEIISRLLLDQIYPINSRFFAVPAEESIKTLKRTSNVIPSVLYIKETFTEKEPEEDDLKESVEDNKVEDKKSKIILNGFSFNYDLVTIQIDCDQILERGIVEPTEFEVINYQFENTPTVVVRPVIKPEPFDEFNRLFKKGNNVSVELINIFFYPRDNRPTLLVREPRSMMEILMETGEITFSNSSAVFAKIPINSVFIVSLENTIPDARRVHLSMLSQLETRLNKLFTQKNNSNSKNDSVIVSASVVEIRPDSVFFLLDWAKPQEAFLPIISATKKMLSKSPEEYQLEEEVSVSIFRGNRKPLTVDIPKIPKLLKSKMEKNQLPEGFVCREKSLEFTGRMSDIIKSNLKSFSSNEEYQNAIDRLYWLSNRILIKDFLDNQWIKEVKEKYPSDKKITAIVGNVNRESGLNLVVDNYYKAFMPRSRVLSCFSNDLFKNFDIGDVVFAKMIDIQCDQKQFILEQVSEDWGEPIIQKNELPTLIRIPVIPLPPLLQPVQPQPKPIPIPKPIPPPIPKPIPKPIPQQTVQKPQPKPISPPPPPPQPKPIPPPAPPEEKSLWEKFTKWLSS